MAEALPTWDEAISQGASPPDQAAQQKLPTWDEALKTAPDSTVHSPAISEFFKHNSVGRIMGAFGETTASEITEGGPFGMSPETVNYFKKTGVFNDYAKGQTQILGGFNEAIMQPAAAGLDALMRIPPAIFSGAQAAVEKTGEEYGFPNLARDIAALPEAFPMGVHSGLGIPHAPHLPVELAKSRSLGVIGEGERGYFGQEPTPEHTAARNEAAATLPTEEHPQLPGASETPQPNIHEVARNIAPDTFQKYDALDAQRESYRASLNELAEQRQKEVETTAPHSAEDIEALRAKIEEANPRKTKIYQERLDTWTEENEQHIADNTTGDTAKMQETRRKLQEIDYQMRDLAPDVSAAYRTAQEHLPQEAEAIETQEPQTTQHQESETQPSEATQSQETPAPEIKPETAKPIEAQKQAIVDDVSKQLVAAGRPDEEASASAQLVAEHYQARSERFGGKNGTAEEMYSRDGANIKAGRERTKAREFAQSEQGRELQQPARGKIRLATDQAKATITLMKSANASTFIHETGHHWLEEMMNDATDHYAPESLKNDAATVRKWLGVGDGEEIATRQHEKFARGFERYLMEGTAPSKALANVFAKFKEWLTNIYKTVDKLRSPINDDIRDVFDRLLSSNPEKTVIAPDHEPGKMLADIHEADAQHTEPAEAAPVRDNIEKEIDRTANLHDPEVHDALIHGQARPATESGELSAAPANTGEPSAESQSTTITPSVAAQLNTVAEGGGEVGGKSGEVPSAATEPAKPEPRGQQPDGPNAVFGKPESNLVDKAGNIRLDNLNTPEDVNEVLRQTAAANDDFMGARRGVISDAQAIDLADALGMDPATLNMRKIGQAFNAEQIIAARKLLIQSATSVRDSMAKAASAAATDNDLLAYAEEKARHQMIQEHVAGITAEAGRALRAFRKLEGSDETKALGDFLKEATGKTLFQLKEEAQLGMALDTPQKVSKFINDSRKPGFGDMLLEYWINGLISGPATHTTYMIGNTLSALWKAIPETGAASLIGKAHEYFGHEGGGVETGEIGAQLKSAVKELPTALSAAGKALKSGVTTLLPGEEARSMPLQAGSELATPGRVGNEPISWEQLRSDTFGAIKGMRDAFVAAGELVKSGGTEGAATIGLKRSPLGSIPDVTIKGVQVPVGSAIRVPGRAIAAIHSFFRTMNYSMEKAALAYREASKDDLSEHDFAAKVGDLVTNPSEELMQQARASATSLTLMGQGGQLTQAVSRLTNTPIFGFPLLKFIDPFVHIGANVIEQSILRRTPIGLLSPELRADLSGANGAAVRDFAQARMLVGTTLAITVGGLAAQGLVSGSGPSDPKQNAAWRLLGGNQPHSVKINDMWYDTHRLGPLGMIIGIAADMHDVVHAMGQEDITKVASMLVHSITQNILDESFMRGPSDLIKALDDGDRYGDKYAQNLISSFVPFSVGMSQAARAVDPYTRQTRSVMDSIKAKIPFVSEGLYPKRDVWGEPIANKDVLGPAGFSAIYETKISKDPVNKVLLALNIFPPRLEQKIRGVKLTDQQYDDYSRIAGKMAKMRLDAMINTPGFASIPPGVQTETINKTLQASRETARSIIMMQNPAIIKRATDNKLQVLQGKKPSQNQ